MSNQVPPGPGQQPPAGGAEPPYGPYSSQVPDAPSPGGYPQGAPPPGPYQSGAPQPPAGQPSYEPYGQQPQYGQPSYEPYGQPSGGQPSYEPYGQQPSGGQPQYGQPSYGPSPQPGGYGAQPPGAASAPYGSYPTPPKSSSGGKIIAIVAAAVVVVGLVIGGVVLLTRDDDSSAGGPSTTSTSTKKSPKPSQTTDKPSPEPTESDPEGPSDAERTLAETAYTAAAGYEPFECTNYAMSLFDDTDYGIYCWNDNFEMYKVFKWPDVETALAAIRSYGAYGGGAGDYVEGTWSGGTSFVRDDYSYEEIRCYADVPLCLEATGASNAQQAADQFSHIIFADAAGIETLKGLITGGGV